MNGLKSDALGGFALLGSRVRCEGTWYSKVDVRVGHLSGKDSGLVARLWYGERMLEYLSYSRSYLLHPRTLFWIGSPVLICLFMVPMV